MAFKISGVKTRYFEVEMPDNGKILLVEPPKLKTLKMMEDIQKDEQAGIAELAALNAKLLSKNKQNRKISADQVMEWLDIDQMKDFMKEFLSWLKREKNTNPN